MNPNQTAIYFAGLAVLGLALRLVCTSRGHNFDVDSYRIVADIIAHGGNVYKETSRYNYGPIWFYILHGLDSIPWIGEDALTTLRWKVAIFLSLVDIGLFAYLTKEYSLKTGALFFFNPISMIITGYHSQFDNLAILVGMLSVFVYSKKKNDSPGYISLVGIGLSLCIKHILFLFPLWLAFKATKQQKAMTVLVPYIVFLCCFLPFIPDGSYGILKHVFLYKSFNNAPLWSMILPNVVYSLVPRVMLFFGALFILGLYFKEAQPEKLFFIYTIGLVSFSSAIANQYIAICIPAIAIFWNKGYLFYTIVGTIYLLVDGNGLHIHVLGDLLRWHGKGGYQILAVLLAYGFLITAIGNPRVRALFIPVKTFGAWLKMELLNQIK